VANVRERMRMVEENNKLGMHVEISLVVLVRSEQKLHIKVNKESA
jgi:hypothetical protein